MADECDKSENISSPINQDAILHQAPRYSDSKSAEVGDYDETESNEAKETAANHLGNNKVAIETVGTNTNTNFCCDEDDYTAIYKDGNNPSTGARKKTTHDQTAVNGAKKGINSRNILYNMRSLSNLASTYKLELFERNLLIIYNFINVEGYSKRLGTIEDADELEKTFKIFGFEVEREGNEDLKCKELLKKLDELDKRDFTEYGCVAVAVMTHGTLDGWLMAKDCLFSENEIINRLKARTKPTLVTKPVVLIIQACRGYNSTKGVKAGYSVNCQIYRDQKEEIHHYYLPVESDMLVIHSCYVGKPAYRPWDGSWFIQTLCKKIRELAATEDLETIMIEVKREVACNKYYAINTSKVVSVGQHGETEYHKQIPTVTSTLIRKLFLINKADVPMAMSLKGNVIKELFPTHDLSHANRTQDDNECACLLDQLDYLKKLLR